MKLKDIFPKWLLRERAYGELELGGGSFAHLTEDTEYSELQGDWLLRLALPAGPVFRAVDALPPPNGDGATREIDVFPDRIEIYGPAASLGDVVLSVWDIENANAPYLEVHRDGGLHWGSGVAAPDATLLRSAPGVIFLGDGYGEGNQWGSYFSTQDVNGFPSLFIYGKDTAADPSSSPVFGVQKWSEAHPEHVIMGDGSLHWGDGTAAPDTTLRRSDPNTWGTGLTLIDSDEGGLVVGDPAGDHYITLYPSSMYVSIYDAREAGVANTTLSAGQLHMRKNSHEVGIEPSTTGHLAIVETGSGLEVKSPDGTAYVLAPPNGGGAAVWYPA